MKLSLEQEKVQGFYDNNPQYEWNRLNRHPLEFALTKKLILEYGFRKFASGPSANNQAATVLDIGGGPGRYALWLAELGHSVTLLDLSKGNLEIARTHASQSGLSLAATVHGTATDLSDFADSQFDVVLLFGPLYHLADLEDRIRALVEARRVLKPGGVAFAAFLNRYGLIRYLAKDEPDSILTNQEMINSVLATGDAHSEQYPASFSNFSYWSRPDEIEPLMRDCGFEMLQMISAEGAVAYLDDGIQQLDTERWNAWVELNYRLGKQSDLYGAGIHLVYAGKLAPS